MRPNRNTSGSLGEREMLQEHEPRASVFTAFTSSPKFLREFQGLESSNNSIETRRTCFLNGATRKINHLLTLIIKMLRRQRGRVVRAPDLKSVGRGFKSRSDR